MDVVDRQEIETVFTANLKQLETAIIRYGNAMESAAARQDKAFRQSHANISRSADRLNASLRNAIAVGALIVAGREVLEYETTWRNLTNTLGLYEGVLGPAADATKRLNAVAIGASVGIGELGNLTGAVSRAVAGVPGVFDDSSEAVFQFAESVSKGAQISNNGAAAVSGALTQLSQAIGSPRVQLGEFNSIIEGTPRLAQAFADGIDAAGGSVSKLRALITKGEVSGVDLITGLLSQTDKLRAEFGSLTTGSGEAFTRLQNRLAEFIGTNQGAIDAQQAFAGAISFVADNLEALTEAIIIGGAALAGFFGASALASITAGLGGMTKGLQGAAAAMALLNGVSKVFGGPLVIGVTAVAGALAFFALNGNSAAASMDRLESTLADYRRTGDRIQTDTKKLTGLQDELTDAINNQQTAIEATKRAEIAALSERIAKNRELLEIQRLLARSELGKVREAVAGFSNPTLAERFDISAPQQLRKELSARASVVEGTLIGVDDATRQAEFLRLLDDQVRKNMELEAAGERLSDKQRAAYDLQAEYLQLLDKEKVLAEDVAALGRRAPIDANNDFRDDLGQGFYVDPKVKLIKPGGEEEDDGKAVKDDTLAALEEIRAAYNATFDSEIEAVERVFRARIAAINKSTAGERERVELTIQAEEVLSAEIGKIKAEQQAEEDDYAAAQAERAADQTANELALLDEVLFARDAAAGRTLALIEREFAARRAEIEAEIDDAGRRNEALAALEEEKAITVAAIRERALQDAREFSETDVIQSEIDRINEEAGERINALQVAYGAEIDQHKEAQDAIVAIIAEANDRITELSRDRLIGYVDDVGSIFGSLAGVIADYGGKQSGAYKALIAVERAFTFASLTLSIAQGIGKAIKIGFPQNIPLIAGVTAQGAQALSLLAGGGKGFQRGGETGAGADTDVRGYVHANEYVQDAPTVRHYGVDAMRAIHLRKIPKHVLQGYQRGGYVGIAPPAISRAADRITQLAASPITQVNQSSTSVVFKQGDVTLNGRDDGDIIRQLRGELRQSEARVAAQVMPALAGDIRRGGGEIGEALQQTYALSRVGR